GVRGRLRRGAELVHRHIFRHLPAWTDIDHRVRQPGAATCPGHSGRVKTCPTREHHPMRPVTLRGPRAGFTLVEMLVVLAIIAALAALTVGVLRPYREGHLLTVGANQLQGWLINARQYALRDRVSTGLR